MREVVDLQGSRRGGGHPNVRREAISLSTGDIGPRNCEHAPVFPALDINAGHSTGRF